MWLLRTNFHSKETLGLQIDQKNRHNFDLKTGKDPWWEGRLSCDFSEGDKTIKRVTRPSKYRTLQRSCRGIESKFDLLDLRVLLNGFGQFDLQNGCGEGIFLRIWMQVLAIIVTKWC